MVHFLYFHCKTLSCYVTISGLLLLDSVFPFTSASPVAITIGICHPEWEGTFIVFSVVVVVQDNNNFRKQICCLIFEKVFKIKKIT